MTSVVLVSHELAGHRAAYVRQFTALFEGWGWTVELKRHWSHVLFDPRPVLILMVEESTHGYAAAAAFRALSRRRTAGLLFRATDPASLRGRVKRTLLSPLKALASVTTASIIPFDVEPGLAANCKTWIYDPQLWDIGEGLPVATPLSRDAEAAGRGRRRLVALGLQNRAKGFGLLCETYLSSTALRDQWCFVAVGAVSPDLKAQAAAFVAAGGVLVDRFVSDEELASMYGVADLIWGVYEPAYDQASGVFGRAYQTDRPVLVREGSAVARMADGIGARYAQTRFDPADVAGVLSDLTVTPKGPRLPVQQLQDESLATLRRALSGAS